MNFDERLVSKGIQEDLLGVRILDRETEMHEI